jgi:hypothetical protein
MASLSDRAPARSSGAKIDEKPPFSALCGARAARTRNRAPNCYIIIVWRTEAHRFRSKHSQKISPRPHPAPKTTSKKRPFFSGASGARKTAPIKKSIVFL